MADESMLKKIGDGIVNFAPTLGGILMATGVGAPVGAALNALAAVGKAFGLGDNPTPEAVATAILSDPDARLKVMAAENAFTLAMRDSDIKALQLQLADVQNARQLDANKTKTTGKRDANLYILAWVTVMGFFCMTGGLLYFSYLGKPITDSTGVLFMLMGAMATQFGSIYAFFFGSSAGSKAKTELLAKAEPIK